MIERKVVKDKLTEFMVGEYIADSLERVGYSHSQLQHTPLGEKIIIHAARPGLIVGSKGSNIKKMTKALKAKFKLENPQIEIEEIKNQSINASLVAEYISGSLERFGSGGFKGVGYRAMSDAINSGALGIEILISGKIPSSRSKTWRFYMGYLKKCGDVAQGGVLTAYKIARLKTGVVGIQVRIMPPDLVLPDRVTFNKEELVVEESAEEMSEQEEKTLEQQTDKQGAKEEKAKPAKKKPAKKAPVKKSESKEEQKAPEKKPESEEAKE